VNAFASVPLCVSSFVTVTLAAPAVWAGIVAVIVVVLITETFVAALPSTLTVAPEEMKKPVPVIVTAVPPAAGPDAGATPVTVGGGGTTYVNASANVPLCVSEFVTVTLTDPAPCAGVVPMSILVLLTTVMMPVTGLPPMLTVAPAAKPVPVIVSDVPPRVVPEFGATLVTVGAGAT
jgi:hypothetical protein